MGNQRSAHDDWLLNLPDRAVVFRPFGLNGFAPFGDELARRSEVGLLAPSVPARSLLPPSAVVRSVAAVAVAILGIRPPANDWPLAMQAFLHRRCAPACQLPPAVV